MIASTPSEELDRLLSRMTEARLGLEESQKLAELIEAEPDLRHRYLDYCQMHAILVSEHGLLASTVEPSREDLDQVGSHRLSAHVPEVGIGFTVETPRAAVVNLGTDFGVDVMNQDAEIHVFTGEVRVDLHSEVGPNPTPLRLVTGEATRINRRTGLPARINLDRQRFWHGFESYTRHPYVRRLLELKPSAYYPMEPTEDGTKVEDVSGNQASATLFHGRALRPIWTAGRFGAALDFGGPAQLTYAAAKSYPQTKSDQLSVVAWVHARSRPRWASIAKNWAGGDDNRGQFHFGLYLDDGDLEVHIEDDSGEEVIVREGVPLPLDQWHMVAFVADGSHLRLFRNGQQVAAKPYHGLHSNPQIKALGIGTKLNLRGDAPEEHDFNMWDGRLDELAIFNHALSKEEILELFTLAQHSVRSFIGSTASHRLRFLLP